MSSYCSESEANEEAVAMIDSSFSESESEGTLMTVAGTLFLSPA